MLRAIRTRTLNQHGSFGHHLCKFIISQSQKRGDDTELNLPNLVGLSSYNSSFYNSSRNKHKRSNLVILTSGL